MLQIIIWMGCIYLIVKAFEIASSQSHKSPDGKWTAAAGLAIAVAVSGALFIFSEARDQATEDADRALAELEAAVRIERELRAEP